MQYVKTIEDKLKGLISKIQGAGQVEVMVSLDSGSSVILASNDETVTTTNGSSSTTTVSVSPVVIEQNGTKMPVIIEEILPKIKGVVVVSSGARDISVKLNILNAVQTLTGLNNSQIQILIG